MLKLVVTLVILTIFEVKCDVKHLIKPPHNDLLTPFGPKDIPQYKQITTQQSSSHHHSSPHHSSSHHAFASQTISRPVSGPKQTRQQQRTKPIPNRPPPQRPYAPQPQKTIPKTPPQQHRSAPTHQGSDYGATVLRQNYEIEPQGSYQQSYETDNGISVYEQGSVRQLSPEETIMETSGSYSYTAPDGTPIVVKYIANENGYQPQGEHLPTPPPIPEAILKSLEYIRNHPSVEDNKK